MARTPNVTEDRREQIIGAAMRVFAQKGFDRATNKDIAREAHITPGLIYHYFKSKEDLLKVAIESNPLRQLLRSIPPQLPEMSPEDLLRYVAERILSATEDEDFVRVFRIYLPEVIHNPMLAVPGESTIGVVVGFLEKALGAKMASGELRRADAALVAQLFLGGVLAVVLSRQIMREPRLLQYTQEQIVDNLVTLTLQGLLPR